jgi:hypothetical protein
LNRLLLLGFFFLLNCFPLVAQQVIKGIPEDLLYAEIIIVAYEPNDLIPAEAESHEFIYKQTMPLAAMCAQANLELQAVAKKTFPLSYRIVPKELLASIKVGNAYIFEPGKLYGSFGPWSSVPLYIRRAASGQVYEIGHLPKNAIFSAEKVLTHFIQFLPKNLPVQASEK